MLDGGKLVPGGERFSSLDDGDSDLSCDDINSSDGLQHNDRQI